MIKKNREHRKNHIIQNAIIKFWKNDNNKVFCYKFNEHKNKWIWKEYGYKKVPAFEKDFYNYNDKISNDINVELEKKFHLIENEIVLLISKLLNQIKFNGKININGKELFTLICHLQISLFRTPSVRKFIENMKNDSYFKKHNNNIDKTSKEMQNNELKSFLNDYEYYLLGGDYKLEKPHSQSSNFTMKYNLDWRIQTKKLFLKFKYDLVLTDKHSFLENGFYTFYTLTKNIGILLYDENQIKLLKRNQSKIFKKYHAFFAKKMMDNSLYIKNKLLLNNNFIYKINYVNDQETTDNINAMLIKGVTKSGVVIFKNTETFTRSKKIADIKIIDTTLYNLF